MNRDPLQEGAAGLVVLSASGASRAVRRSSPAAYAARAVDRAVAAMIRHFGRHLYQSVYDHLDTALADLDWKAPGGFKEFVVTTQSYLPEENVANAALQPNLVALTLVDEEEETPEELGDGLVSIDVSFVVDIYGENQAVALAIAEDLKDVLRGRIGGHHRIIPVYDYTTDPRTRLDGVWCEVENVVRIPSQRTELRRQWQLVRFVAHVEYVPTTGGT